jgi:glucokinase-like ROK family protein
MVSQNIIALDIGGTKINIGLIDQNANIIKSKKVPTPKNITKKEFDNHLIKLISSFKNKQTVKIGISIAGQISWPDGVIISSPNLKFLDNHPLQKNLKKALKLPVYIDNDAHCFTLSESTLGAGKKYNTVIGITLGTGIGGGIVVDNKLIRGANNTAGEFGHMMISDHGVTCSCQLDGHLESYTSGRGMIKIFKQLTGKTLNTFEIEKLYNNKNPNARETFRVMSEYLGIGLANIANVNNPDLIVLGGGITRIKPIWKSAISTYFPKYIFYKSLSKTKIVVSKSEDDSLIIGAAIITTLN